MITWPLRAVRLASIIIGMIMAMAATSVAFAETLCQVADPKDETLNVRSSPGGEVINRLKNGRTVRLDNAEKDSQGRVWASVSGPYKGEWRNWGWMFRTSLKCINTDRLSRVKVSVSKLRSVGLAPQAALESPQFPISCDIVPNGWGVTISRELLAKYKARGFSEKAVCLGLGGDRIFFDPETGRPLPLYELPGDLAGPHPLWLPDCFKSVKTQPRLSYIVGWRPTGCKIRYNPSTGQKISDPAVIELSSGGEAGGGVDEDDQSSSVSQDRLQAMVNGK